MFGYVLDTSAVVRHYTNQTPHIRDVLAALMKQRKELPCTFFIPNICIPEVLNVFAKFHHEPDEHGVALNRGEYQQCLNDFKRDIHWGRLFYSYDVNRYHIIAADEIIPFEYRVKRESRPNRDKKYDRLSAMDVLVIAMASELAFLNGAEHIALLTADARMKKVCDAIRSTSSKDRKHLRTSWFSDLPADRWPIPRAFNLCVDDPKALRQVIQGKADPAIIRA